MYTKICLWHKLGTFCRVGAIFPLQLSWWTQFDKIKNKLEIVFMEHYAPNHLLVHKDGALF